MKRDIKGEFTMRIAGLVLAFFFTAFAAEAHEVLGRKFDIRDERSTAAPAPLVIAMHGFLGTARSMRKKTRYDALARKHGFVVVYPNGKRRRWNDGRSPSNRTDDVKYLAAIIQKLVADGVADPNRVFLAGHSNGGGMAMRMACDRPDLIAGIAVIATKVAANYPCRDGAPMPTIFFHGTQDPVSPHGGRPKGDRLGETLSSEASLALWAARNTCGGVGANRTVDRKDDDTEATIIRYARCRKPLVHVLIKGHGHGWPGAGPRLKRVQGPATQEVDAAILSWQFFSAL